MIGTKDEPITCGNIIVLKFVISYMIIFQNLDVGDLTERFALKKQLHCKPFSWYMENIWQDLFILTKDVTAWGSVSITRHMAHT